MITAGIDAGAQTVKVALVRDEEVLATSLLRVGMEREQTAKSALEQALFSAAMTEGDVDRVIATGAGRKEIVWADDMVTEIAAGARGANFSFPRARTVIDVGAEESRGIKIDLNGKVEAFAKNDKCAAGVGSFVESMARALEMSVPEMSQLSLESDRIVPMNVTCVVFAESEVVSLIHAKTPKADIARAIHEAIATRIASMVRRVGVEEQVVLIGGVAKNAGVVERLTQHLGVSLFLADEPRMAGAIGAALLGSNHSGE